MIGRPAFVTACLGLLTAVVAAQTVPQPWLDVIRNLRHPSADTRLAAVVKLGDAGYSAAAEAVAPLVADADDRVQAAAIDAELSFFLVDRVSSKSVLGVGGSKSRAQLAFEAGPLYRSDIPASPVVIDRLLAAMRDENARVRFDAIHALGFIGESPLPPAQARALAAELDHYDPIMRAATARVLGRLATREIGDRLMVAMEDSSAIVRQYAIEAIGRVHDQRALVPLRGLFTRGRGNLEDTLLALARIASPDDLAAFRQRLGDRDPAIRRAAFEGIGRLHDSTSIDGVRTAFKSEKSDVGRLAAAFALQILGDTQTHTIASMLVLREVNEQARDYLFEIGPPAVPGILEALKVATDPRHRADLLQLIGYLGTSAETSVVERSVADKDERVRRAAAVAMQRLRRAKT